MKKIIIGLILVGAALVSISSMFYHNRMSTEDFTTTKTVKQLNVEDRSMPITVVGVSGNQTKINYTNSRGVKYKIKESNGALDVERRKTIGINFSIFNFGERNSKMTIEVPKNQLKELEIETSNAGISAENLDLHTLDMETTNGKVSLSEIDARSADVETNNGKLELKRMNFNEGSFETSNSKIVLEELKFDEGEFQTSNGKVDLKELAPAKSLDIQTSNARVEGTVVGKKEDFSIISKTSNASTNLDNRDSGSKELEVRTSNGEIEVDFVR
ncbi:DUF4097 family beta strand repeat-containing protein [Enterococcus gilvus]|jgi:DUF4097 and DUF4098 domain-containing protein YvlB|uniref:DUF4097 domain-containing protein n=1 Tax=Enterococcus gilvus ATCC BAA-350 TaxID=1158614 RepID=R2XRQ7_9ENTE|nr:DUF4097 family beta strand repeat-containing protein [Enterococcus gilvus]AXG38966.1 hypothetical protein EGCR1_09680 [Enterococcus gilvus]EOI57213.1 hypothetical protein UKC_01427 [Enterococcus gilvus ATCC BAA-350]EOW83213.1 hypothetical protein I592_02540 [Enterococcus gilvus ATCC BAA-350]MBS5820046.1 DUF4097 family beta strand repeat protein [Enterococcus gilvus]OJG41227.1 hypothetical protein RV02_GL001163 [Enterococcus gilvus]